MAVVTATETLRTTNEAPAIPLADRHARGFTAASALKVIWRPLALIAFACWVLVVGAHHEPWFDEAQAWLIARDSSLPQLLFTNVRYEGSPGLWHALLWLAVRAGLPFAQLHLIAAACAIGGAAVVLWRAPFPALLRLAIIGSYFFAYQYAIVARSYSLALLLIPLVAASFAQRVDRPWRYALLIALIANSNAHGFAAAGILGVEFAWAMFRAGRLRDLPACGALLLALLGGIFALLTTLPPSDGNFLAVGGERDRLMSALHFLLDAFVDRLRPWRSDTPASWELSLSVYISVAAMAMSVPLLRRAGTHVLAAGLAAALIGFSAAVYASPWQSGLLFLLWIACLWISWPAAEPRGRARLLAGGALLLVCLAQWPQAITTGLRDLREGYSSAPRAAAAIGDWRQAHPGGRIAALGPWAFAVQPWFPGNIFADYHGGAARPSYLIWSRDEPWQTTVTPADWQRALAANPDLILVSVARIGPGEWAAVPCPDGYRRLMTFSAAPWWRGRPYGGDDLVLVERSPGSTRCLASPVITTE
jgi:hypothetical protein